MTKIYVDSRTLRVTDAAMTDGRALNVDGEVRSRWANRGAGRGEDATIGQVTVLTLPIDATSSIL